MSAELITAILAFLAAVIGAILWYLKRRPSKNLAEKVLADVLEHQKDVRLSIKEAEKRAEEGRHVADRALAGELSRDDVNRVLSGKPPNDG